MKSVNVIFLLFFFSGHSHTSLFLGRWGSWETYKINKLQLYSSCSMGVTSGNCRGRMRRWRTGSLASPVGQGESVSLMACSLCRCHLVIILRQPSASWSCRARAAQSSGSCVTGRIHAASPSTLTRYSACLRCPKGRAGRGRRGDRRNKKASFELSATI